MLQIAPRRGDRTIRNPKFSEGASGAFMAESADGRFVIKSMEDQDVDTLLQILPDITAYFE